MPTLAPLLFALAIWSGQERLSQHPWVGYFLFALALTLFVMGVIQDLIATQLYPNAPLIFRVIRYLSFALLLIATLSVLSRKKT